VVEQAGVGMVYAANFSIGVNLFYRLARAAAEIFAPFPMYDPFLTESHHKMKKDAPSGTALKSAVRFSLTGGPRYSHGQRAGGYFRERTNWL